MTNQDTDVVRWFFQVIRRWLWLILICTAMAGIAGLIVTSQMSPVYKTSVDLLVEPSKESMTNEYNAIVAAERLASTYSEMLKSKAILEAVIRDLDLHTSVGQLAKKITTQPIPETQLVRLTVEGESPEQAAEIANGLAESFVSYIRTTQSERYADDLARLKSEIQDIDNKINTNQSLIDGLQAQAIEATDEQDQLETSLSEIRGDIRLLQQDKQAVELTMAQVMDDVKILQSASTPISRTALPYRATVVLLVRQVLATGNTDYSSILASERLTQTYAQILQSHSVLQEAIDQLKLPQSVEAIQQKIGVEPIVDTQLIQLTVEDYDVEQAVNLANTIAEVFVKQIQASLVEPYISRIEKIEASLADLVVKQETTQGMIKEVSSSKVKAEIDIGRLESVQTTDRTSRLELQDDYDRMLQISSDSAESVYITESASIPESPATNSLLYLGLSIVMGALVGVGFAFLLENQDDTIHTSNDIEKELGISVLGKIGQFKNEDTRPVVISDPLSPISEAFLMLANNISFATPDRPTKTVLITSPSPSEGKTLVLANLAVTMARLGQIVVAVDADLRIPELHKLFGLEQDGGLTSALLGGDVEDKLCEVNVKGLKVLPCGKLPSSPTKVIGSVQMRSLLETLRNQADVVSIDCPPVLPVADTTMLVPMVDYVILVLRADHSRSREARDALQSLKQTGANVIGVVLNAVPAGSEGYYHYSHNLKEKQKFDLRMLLRRLQTGKFQKSQSPKTHQR